MGIRILHDLNSLERETQRICPLLVAQARHFGLSLVPQSGRRRSRDAVLEDENYERITPVPIAF